MAISLASLQTSSTLRPPRILMHGVHGVGKTTFAAGADAPVVIMTEDGLGMLKVPHFPLATSYADVEREVRNLQHDRGRPWHVEGSALPARHQLRRCC